MIGNEASFWINYSSNLALEEDNGEKRVKERLFSTTSTGTFFARGNNLLHCWFAGRNSGN